MWQATQNLGLTGTSSFFPLALAHGFAKIVPRLLSDGRKAGAADMECVQWAPLASLLCMFDVLSSMGQPN